jgi:MFS transporter, putative metabolite:H+ symporter
LPNPPRITVAARLDRLPQSRTIRRMVVLLSLGGCFEFYDLFFTAYIAPALYASGIFTPTTRGFLGIQGFASFVASLFAGLFVGSLFFSRICDRFGRRAIFSYSLLWYSVATCVMALQSTAGAINLWRFIAGVGIGVELVTIDSYLSELVPKDVRGAAFAFQQTVCFAAVPIAALISWFLVPRRFWGLDGWRWVAIIGASGAVFIWFIRRAMPESPRWLEQQGRHEEADRLMTQIENRVRAEIGKELPAPAPGDRGARKDNEPSLGEGATNGAAKEDQTQGQWMEMWNPTYRRRTIMLSVFHLFETLGYYGFANWAPTFLLSKGIAVTQSLQYTFVIALASPFGPLMGQAFADRFERKWQVVSTALMMAFFGLLFSAQSTAFGVILFGILITLSSNWFSFAYHTYQSELYPTRIRARAVGFVYSWSRFGVIISSFTIAWFLRQYGTIGVFTLIAGGMLISAAAVAGWGPRTNRRPLEEISH